MSLILFHSLSYCFRVYCSILRLKYCFRLKFEGFGDITHTCDGDVACCLREEGCQTARTDLAVGQEEVWCSTSESQKKTKRMQEGRLKSVIQKKKKDADQQSSKGRTVTSNVQAKSRRERKMERRLPFPLTFRLTLYVPIIAILDIWKTALFYEGESVVYDGFKYVWPVKG